MSETFEKVLVKDDRIGCLTPQLKYQVFKGGQNITGMPFKAISQTTSAHVFNVPVPSLETVISREVLWSSIVTLRITGSNSTNPGGAPKDPNGFLVNYGVTDALAPFPLHSLVATMTATINNNTVSMNTADVLAPLMRLLDPEEMAYYDDSTPTTLDYLGNYRDGVNAMNFSINTFGNQAGVGPAVGDTLRPVVYFPGDQIRVPPNAQAPVPGQPWDPFVFWGTGPQVYESYPNNVLAYDMNRTAGTGKKHRPRGSFRLLNIYALDQNGNRRLPIQTDNEVFVRFQVVEPLLLSPFIFGTGMGKQGFYGIQTMNFQMNLLANANRAWRSVPLARAGNEWVKTAVVDSFEDSTLYFQFLTPHASEMLTSRNVVPFFELPIYRTANFPTILGRGIGQANVDGSFALGGAQSLSSANIQLAGIPDKLIIFVRRNLGVLTCCDTDRYLTIEGIRINFNNQSGLLSSMSQLQLYKNAVLSGLVNMSWDEFSGITTSVSGNNTSPFSEPFGPFAGLGARPGNGANGAPGFKYVSTTGSVLVLNFGEVIQLTDEYYAPGSLGTFNLQITLDVRNNHQDTWVANSYEMVIIPMNSGTFVNERGTSSTFTTLLTRQEVLDSLQQPAYSNHQLHRMIGGGFLDNLRSSLGWVRSKANDILPHVKTALGAVGAVVPGAQTGANVLGALGYGMSGGGRRKIADRVA